MSATVKNTEAEMEEAKAIIRQLKNEIDSFYFGDIHTLDPRHPARAAHDRAAAFLEAANGS